MNDVWVKNAVLQSQVIKKIKHVFDGSRQHITTVHCAEYRLKQVVYVLLQCTLYSSQHHSDEAHDINIYNMKYKHTTHSRKSPKTYTAHVITTSVIESSISGVYCFIQQLFAT